MAPCHRVPGLALSPFSYSVMICTLAVRSITMLTIPLYPNSQETNSQLPKCQVSLQTYSIGPAITTCNSIPLRPRKLSWPTSTIQHSVINNSKNILLGLSLRSDSDPKFRCLDCSTYWHFASFSRFVDVGCFCVIIV